MPQKVYDITLDIKSQNIFNDSIEVVSGDIDSNTFNINLVDNYSKVDLTGNTIEVVFAKPDNTTVVQNMSNGVSIVGSATQGRIAIALKTNTIAAHGICKAEVRILASSKILTSAYFEFRIRKPIINADTLNSTNEFPVLEQLVEDVGSLIENLPEIQDIVEDFPAIQSFFDSAQTAEAGRVAAENTRVQNEAARQESIADIENRWNTLTTAQQQEAEVINARTSTIKATTFPALTDRIEAIEEDVAAGADISAIQTQVTALQNEVQNTLARASVSLSNTAPVQSFTADVAAPVDASFSAPDMMVNLLGRDGDFENGLSRWTLTNSPAVSTEQKVFGAQSLKFTVASQAAAYDISGFINSHVYFISAYLYKLTSSGLAIQWQGGSAISSIGTIGAWVRKGAVKTYDSALSTKAIQLLSGDSNGGYFDGIMIIDLTALGESETDVDKLLAKYPYINGIQPLVNPMVKVSGKNIYNYTSCRANPSELLSLINGGIKAQSTTTTTYYYSEDLQLNRIKASTAYYFKAYQNIITTTNARFATILLYDKSGAFINEINTSSTITNGYINAQFTTPSNAYFYNMRFGRAGIGEVYNVNYTEIQLEEGIAATTYEPHKESSIILPGEFCKIGSYADTVKLDNGVAKKLIAIKKYVLQASDIIANSQQTNVDVVSITQPSNYKSIALGSNASFNDLMFPNFYNGTFGDNTSKVGTCYIIQAGKWGLVVPKGTYANLAAAQAALAGTTLWYALATPTEEIIDAIGSLGCFAGQNTISVETGMVYEKANTVLSTDGQNNYAFNYINNNPNVPNCPQTYRNQKIISILKNGIEDIQNWTILANQGIYAYGKEVAYQNIIKFDPTAEYYVLYQMLPEEYNNQQISLTAYYQQNLLGAHNAVAETVENLQKQINNVEIDISDNVKTTLANWKTWKAWVPTLTWSTATPTIFVVTRYVIVGNMCNFTGYISTSNGGGATNLTITLPVAPKNTGQVVTVDMFELVGSTYTKVIGQIDTTNPANKIVLNNFAVATSGSAFALSFSGFYEI